MAGSAVHFLALLIASDVIVGQEFRGPAQACTCRPGDRGPAGPKGEPGRGTNVQAQLDEINQRLLQLEAAGNRASLPVNGHAKSCRDILQRSSESGIYTIHPFSSDISTSLEVYCDQSTDGGGWMVIQRRVDDAINFEKGWDEYKDGFGDLRRNYWTGLQNLYSLTKTRHFELRVDLADFNDVTVFEKYGQFSIGSEEQNFTLTAQSYTGTAGDSLSAFHSGNPFSTHDRDNDGLLQNCARDHNGAWWYGHGPHCFESNPNGYYFEYSTISWQGIVWNAYRYGRTLKSVEMKIRESE